MSSFGVLFDMDGVLVDSNPTHKRMILDFCNAHGTSITEEFLQQHIYGRTNKEWIPIVFPDASEEEVLALSDEKEQLFREQFSPRDNMVPGLPDFLKDLSLNHIPLVLATSAPAENADYILKTLDIRHYFNHVLTMADVSRGKPDPDIYLKSADRIGFPPEKCIVIEDSIAGVASGVGAGCTVIGITTTHSPSELSGCSLIEPDFRNMDYQILSRMIHSTD
ncbi:HAD family phosphatase [Balneolaceae bacterium ANBcel3]|nr:HAD family phosphatase [Balneolaceae bacterium ANBcel3]